MHNPLELAHHVHDLLRILWNYADLMHDDCREAYKFSIQIADRELHEIIEDYERRGMEYDGPSS